MKITIIGAGIGGLTAAIALKQKGFEVEIFEASKEFKKAGSGINLAINAMQIYQRLGVYEDIMKYGNYTDSMKAVTKDFQEIVSTSFPHFEKKYGAKNVAIHRATLHEILVSHLGSTKIFLNKKLKKLEQNDGTVNLIFEDGSSHVAKMVIGADGIHSKVRKSIFENTELRDAKQVCWRGIAKAEISAKFKTELSEIWGKGSRFGFVHITDDQIYWFALINKKKFLANNNIDLLDVFSDYPPVVTELLKGTNTKNILCNEIWDLKPIQHWYKGNVCLLGDAAHATTPNMGQGAVQAIESAMALSICLSEEKNTEIAFLKYERLRRKKANFIISTSWMMGKLAQSSNPLVCFIRNSVLKLTPKSVTEKQTDKVLKLDF